MRVNISDIADQYPFERVPVGVHEVPATIELDDGKIVNTHWLIELTEDRTLYFANGVIKPDGRVENLEFWHRREPKDVKK